MDWKTGLKRGPFSDTQANHLIELMSGLDSGQVQWLCGYLTGISPLLQEAGVSTAPVLNTPVQDSEPIWILYGTHTGNCESLSKLSATRFEEAGLTAKVSDMGSFKTKDLKDIKKLLILISTDGEGDMPVMAEELYEFLQSKKVPTLGDMQYAVLSLGDSSYTEFCQAGKDFDAILEKLGATRLQDRVDCDVDYEEPYEQWMAACLKHFVRIPEISGAPVLATPPLRSQGKVVEEAVVYDRKNPYEATITKKIQLNGRYSSRETIHLELDLKGSGLQYEPGDALGVYAMNSTQLIDSVLSICQFSGDEQVDTYHGRKSLSEALVSDYELTPLTGVSLKKYADVTGSQRLQDIAETPASIEEYIHGRDIYDLLKEEPFTLTPDELIGILRKNAPRMYSIASCQDTVEDEVHLVVSVVRYEAYGRYKEGYCSAFLSDRIKEDERVRVFVDPNNRFKLPKDPSLPIIMVGAGTGIAPFRSFVQQRGNQGAGGRSWLFFGERNFTTDFLYQTEWQQYVKEGVLTQVDVAFSRDQQEKVYVQHKMLERGKELFSWLEEGAYFYVCGDAKHMAKDVNQSLKKILEVHGGMTEEKAGDYIKQLQLSARYQTDIY